MGKLGKDLIESLRQAARLSVGKKAPKKIKQNRPSFPANARCRMTP